MKVKGEDDDLEWQPVPLANFDARVVEEVAQTIGASARRVFLIRASFDCSLVC